MIGIAGCFFNAFQLDLEKKSSGLVGRCGDLDFSIDSIDSIVFLIPLGVIGWKGF
jgi:hypothetical protein